MSATRDPAFPAAGSAVRARPVAKLVDDREPLIRAELFGPDRLEQHAESLAVAQQVAKGRGIGGRWSARLRDNGRVLLAAYRTIVAAVHEQRAITPSAEWLVDNFHVVEQQIHEIREDLPPGYYRQLPKLASGPLAGAPRVFGIAWAFVAHTDSLVDPALLTRFVRAYQRVQPLTIGELWAVAITLRIVLVENLRRATEVIVGRRAARQDADRLADRILAEAGASDDAPCRRMPRTMTKAFAVQLVQRLRDHDPAVTPGLRWLDESLAAQGTDSGAIVADELRQQGAMNVTVRNIVTSMRLLSAIDWSEFFESVSLVDAALRDGSGFAAMDFPTRDMYRHAIEELARGSGRTELEIVAAALGAPETPSDAAADTDIDTEQSRRDAAIERERRRDPGYRLVGAGRIAFERSVGFRPTFGRRLARLQRSFGIVGYAGSVVGLCATVVVLLLIGLATADAGLPVLAVVGLLAILPASEVAVMLMNRRVTRVLGPAVLPALECKEGVPTSLRSMVAVPVLLASVDGVDESIDRLEVHFLASPDDDLCFALLSDWPDAPTEHAADDDVVLARAAAGIAELNRRYGRAPAGARFVLLHRRRLWNPLEGRWIGWERKRGKLHELNRWLRGATDTTFLPIAGVMPVPPEGVRFVITLDADTRLPHGVARQLVGKLAHPLNRPGFDRRTGVVVRGHAVLQPRITPSLPSDGRGSRFQRVFAGPRGLDPYAFAASDVYQDLLGEGSYTGKGIYDVDAFEAALAGRVPENAVLSHDLLEGSFARAALVSDVELVEDFPSRYDVAAARQHRWARGDWQLLPWVLGLSGKHVGPHGYAIPRIGRWKLIDNLRRTLVPLASVLLLVFGWLIGGAASVVASAFVLATIVLPTLTPVFDGLAAQRRGLRFRVHVVSVRDDVSLAVQQAFFAVTFLAHQAWLTTDAVVRSLFRMFVRRGRMLEWVTAAQAQSREPLDLAGHYRRMLGAVAAAVGFGVAVAVVTPASLRHALPFLVLWCVAPVVAWWASRSTTPTGAASLQPADQRLLRGIARRTFGYFETFVGPDDNYLPPDNVQEDPRSVVATRTSPTNIGMYLLSVVAARDFGWIGTHDLAERLEATFATIRRLETFHGHLYNWYETRTLRPLDPRYVSSVDSGNLAGHLIAVGNACRAATAELLSTRALRDGVEDQLELIRAATERVRGAQGTDAVTPAHLGDAIAAFAATLVALPAEPSALAPWFDEASTRAETVVDVATTLVAGRRDDASVEVFTAAHSLVECLRSHERDFVKLVAAADSGAERALVERLIALDAIAKELVAAMRFDFLFDTKRKQLAIGYQVVEGRLDPSCYDLLASEARLASFVAIAKGDLPVEHWFHLGRTMAPVRGGAALLSWSGSLFEYLMPNLVLRTPEGSLLHQTCRLVVERQIRYGAQRGVPWGVSESGYNVRDIELTYQYSSFGIPGLGLKRGLGADVVVAPYATALAVMVDPVAAVANFRRLAEAGAVGRYGYYEALDYTSSRLVPGARVAIVRSFMAHHQGMTIVAIGNALHGGAMLERFHAEPTVQATELLLQERIPRGVTIAKPRAEAAKVLPVTTEPNESSLRRFHTPHDRIPRTHLLANGRYAVMFTAAGSGYSRHRDLAITRWREDVTSDGHGSYVYLRDAGSGRIWSAGFQPSGAEPDQYEVSFSEGRAEIVRRDGSIVTTTEVAVSAEEDAEVRRISIANLGTRTREIEVTSYAEIVLTTPAADAAHPAFAKLFVQTEYVPSIATLVATRRRRSPDEPEVFVAHLAVVEGEAIGGWQYETDRARFIGRGRDLRSPASIADGHPLSGTVGTVLDAVFSLRRRVRIPAGATAHVAFWTMVAPTRDAVLDLADRHRDPAAFERVATLAWTHAQVQLQHLGVPPAEAHLFQRLANRILYSDPGLRPPSDVLRRGAGGPPALWPMGISGDLPIVLVRIDAMEDLGLVWQLLRAYEYWRIKQLAVDLVILNERATSYVQDLQAALDGLVRAGRPRAPSVGADARGSVFVIRADQVSAESRGVLGSIARAVLIGGRGSLSEQVRRGPESVAEAKIPVRVPRGAPVRPVSRRADMAREDTEFFNGLGGFADRGREYVTVLGEGQSTPAPWLNVVANESFGFQSSAEGGGYTWSVNSRENQITGWANDPVCDAPTEVLYLRDAESGEIWTPTALPVRRDEARYECRHGQGYTRFAYESRDVVTELLQYVPVADSIKVVRLRIRNTTNRSRRIVVTAYVEWVLGPSRAATAASILTEVDPATSVLLARNAWRADFGERVAFADLLGRQTSWTCDRTEFLGRNGTLASPAALARDVPLSGRTGAGLDPCAALEVEVALLPGATADVVLLLGDAATKEDALALVGAYRRKDLDLVLRDVIAQWDAVLGGVRVQTPDRSMDILLNRWLLYQTLVCRMWSRSAGYQAGGAYGFRDQLQDSMALMVTRPDLARAHLLRAASRQFVAGDVQHWWLPHSGVGVRTRISDDVVWLVHVTAHYVSVTGDAAVLDEVVPFLDGPELAAHEHESCFRALPGAESGTLFEHCARALERAYRVGAHGLPLIGTGDWNDGMNRVGAEGRGESVWLGWFVHVTAAAFAPLAVARGEHARAADWAKRNEALLASLEREAWDGDWYRRGWYDDGTPLGSATSEECRIDSLAQSWAVLSGVAAPQRATHAMASVLAHLVRRDTGVMPLFTPPFDVSNVDPGYVKGYPPGIRENGGQYTHAALWVVMAFAQLGDGDRAMELFAMLDPIRKSASRTAAHRYKVEPYVVCADVYSVPPHEGRGGWTWYTGSAGWMYRAGLESILGVRVRGTSLGIDPCIPRAWPSFTVELRHRSARYRIEVENRNGRGHGVASIEVDGQALEDGARAVPLVDDGREHRVRVVLGA